MESILDVTSQGGSLKKLVKLEQWLPMHKRWGFSGDDNIDHPPKKGHETGGFSRWIGPIQRKNEDI